MSDSKEYRNKKRFFSKILTIYGRKPCLEILQDHNIDIFKIHLADSNRPAPILKEIKNLAEQRNIEIAVHNRRELSRISKNGQQDQGVAIDCKIPSFYDIQDIEKLLEKSDSERMIALDRVTNPQNLGMIIRSVAASGITALLLTKTGNAKIDSLVIKASAGTVFRAPIVFCDDLYEALAEIKRQGFSIASLCGSATAELKSFQEAKKQCYVLGNETEGVSNKIIQASDISLKIPMSNYVESLNVAIASSIIAFRNKV